MALTPPDALRPPRRKWPLIAPHGAGAEFLRAVLVCLVGVLALGAVLPGASPSPVVTALVFFAIATATAGWLLHHDYPHDRLGLCNYVTLVRLALVSALLVPLLAGSGPSWAFFAVAALALSLDGLDGWLARRQGLTSGFGARFDVEVDSVLALVLALNAAIGTQVGPVAILLGLPRYAFGAAGLFLPWMRRDLPERFSRKAVCVLQLGALIAMQAPVLPPMLALLLVPVVALALIWSFAADVIWLWRART